MKRDVVPSTDFAAFPTLLDLVTYLVENPTRGGRKARFYGGNGRMLRHMSNNCYLKSPQKMFNDNQKRIMQNATLFASRLNKALQPETFQLLDEGIINNYKGTVYHLHLFSPNAKEPRCSCIDFRFAKRHNIVCKHLLYKLVCKYNLPARVISTYSSVKALNKFYLRLYEIGVKNIIRTFNSLV